MMRLFAYVLLAFLGMAQFSSCNKEAEDAEAGDQGEPGEKGDPGEKGAGVVIDADENVIGAVYFEADWPNVIVQLSDDAIGSFSMSRGTHTSGVCEEGLCGLSRVEEIAHGDAIHYRTREFGFCYYAGASCNGSCFIADVPVENAIFQNASETFVQADGSESEVSSKVVSSYFDTISGSCVSTGTTLEDAYEITESYSIPDDLTYPFTAPLKIQ